MNCFTVCLVLWTLCLCAESFWFAKKSSNTASKSDSKSKWDSLRVTFSLDKKDKNAFVKMPLTITEAVKAGFTSLTKDCSEKFEGFRYYKDKDPAVILLFDVKGEIAGIQTSFAENQIKTQKAKEWFKAHPMFTVEHEPLSKTEKHYTLTAYFDDPDNICADGRKKPSTGKETATNVYYKNGTESFIVPKEESGLVNSKWVKGKCFPGMGDHYWYDVSKGMDCLYFQPFFVYYHQKTLIGIGFAAFDYFATPRYEHYINPTPDTFSHFLQVVPDCMGEYLHEIGNVTTFHVYFIDKAADTKC